MKQIVSLLAILLALSACGPAAPADAPQSATSQLLLTVSEPTPGDDATENKGASSGLSEERPASGSSDPQADAPMPDAPPPTAVGAIALPEPAAVSEDGYGVSVLTPAQYDMYLPLNRGGPRGFLTCDYFEPSQGGKFAVANANGRLVTGFDYTASDRGWYAPEGIVPVQKDGKFGAVTAGEGRQIIPFEYDMVMPVASGNLIEAQKGDTAQILLIEAQKGDTTQILDETGAVRYTMERGDAFYTLGGGTDLLLQDGMLRFYRNQDGSPLQNFACDEVRLVSRSGGEGSNGRDLLAVSTGGLWALCDAQGNFLTDPAYDDIGYFTGDYVDFTQNSKKGVLNMEGKAVIKPEWDDLIVYRTSVSVCRDGRWGVYTDIEGRNLTLDPVYDFIGAFGDYGYASYERNGKYGLIDREGNEIVSAKYDHPLHTEGANLEKGFYLLEGENGPLSSGIVNGAGKVILPTDSLYIPGRNGEQYNLVCTPSDKWGYVDRTGRFVIDAKYENADAFIPGKEVAFVKRDGKIALIDRKGKEVLKTVFSDVIGYNPHTMVCAMEYTNEKGEVKSCLARILLPA